MDSALLTVELLEGHGDPIPAAIRVAAYVHRTDTRPVGPGTEPYTAHPLRNAVRLARHGCTDPAVLAAAVLHDTVEDHATELVALAGGDDPSTERALDAIRAWFGPDVERIVAAVTNPPTAPGLDPAAKRAAYAAHVETVIGDPQVLLAKFTDYIDNAGSLGAITDGTKRRRLALKYAPLVPVFAAALERHRDALSLSPTGVAGMRVELDMVAEVLVRAGA
ncbi:conserved hypothetical protein [Rhodococcus sp. RD6.2]|uniref:HD domain-containing protein n=1 Tax=Rhodococcus sp. RD6.2 TaxID=260936 RepID=UPI00063BAFD9|nr:HD domain-containing protein [Rhodococcus sp. RD6.2]CRK50448.1 conserved hypothetical protein [Rhodococcus sp. RD6.2]